jgi:hypothetical protein
MTDYPKVTINKGKKVEREFILHYGDIIETTNGGYFLVVCDGYGQFIFINIETCFVVTLSEDSPYKASYKKEYMIGDSIFDGTSYQCKIVKVYKRGTFEIQVNL